MGLGANSILQGFLLIEKRKRQAQQDRQAEEQQETEKIQAQKDNALVEKREKRFQDAAEAKERREAAEDSLTKALRVEGFKRSIVTGEKASTFGPQDVSEFEPNLFLPSQLGPSVQGAPIDLGGFQATQDFGIASPDAEQFAEGFGVGPEELSVRSQEFLEIQRADTIKRAREIEQLKAKAEVSAPVIVSKGRLLSQADRDIIKENRDRNKEERTKAFTLRLKGLSEAQTKRVIDYRIAVEAANDPLNLHGDLTAETMGVNAGMGNGDLPGGELGIRLLPKIREGMIKEGLRLGFSKEELEKVPFRPLSESIKLKITELAPLTTAIDGMRRAIADGIAQGQFADNVWEGQVIKTVEEFKQFFGLSKYTIELERHHADAVAFARSTGESGRFSDQDMLMSLARMIRPGLLKGEARARIDLFENNARNIIRTKLNGFHPIQRYMAFPNLTDELGLDKELVSRLKGGISTDRILEANPRVGGPDEIAIIDPEGNPVWWIKESDPPVIRERIK